MAASSSNDIEIYHARNLATFAPRTDKGREWIEHNLKPQDWQRGHQGAYYTDQSEVPSLREWMHRDKLVTEIIEPPSPA